MLKGRLARAARGQATRRAYSTPSNHVLDELEARGFVQAITSPQLRTQLETPTTLYAGIDPSASSLHVGNLLPLLGLLHFRARGHHALALIGGATGMIGDPSGRSTERNALTPETLAHNVAGITAQVERFFERGRAYAARHGYEPPTTTGRGFDVVNNYDWFKGMGFLEFLRDVGKLARVNTMLARESVKNRLDSEQGISFTEFSYQLLQAHDFATLHRTHDCRLQLGGSDQWGNIVAGIDMIKRLRSQPAPSSPSSSAAPKGNIDPAFGLTIPLLTTSSGEKFGKSAGNAVWLDEGRTSVSGFYQFFFRAPDADVGKYLRLLTLVPTPRLEEIIVEHAQNPRLQEAQRLLADEVTELVHGSSAVKRAQTIQSLLYSTSVPSLRSADVLDAMASDPRLVRLQVSQVCGVPLSKLAADHGLVKSRSEANRLIKDGGLRVNEAQIRDVKREIGEGDLVDGHVVVLRRGTRDVLVLYVDGE